uniref:Uncharacterized protein n=1 Tax=Cucumis melo TaxID=3656 RepID=A0A9I9E0R2_CUCME
MEIRDIRRWLHERGLHGLAYVSDGQGDSIGEISDGRRSKTLKNRKERRSDDDCNGRLRLGFLNEEVGE